MSRGGIWTRLALFFRLLAGTALAVAAMEPIARGFYYFYPVVAGPGIGPQPVAGSTVRQCMEGCSSSTWQAHGVRRPRPPEAGEPTLLAVGDSFTEAMQVGDDEVFTARLEAALGHRTQVLDVGRSTFAPADYLGLAERYQSEFQPRWTIITFKDHDFQGIERGIFQLARGGGGELIAEGRPVAQPSKALAPLRKNLALYGFATYRWQQLRRAAAVEPPLFVAGAPLAPALPKPPVAEPLEIMEALSRAYRGRVTFVYLSRPQPDGVEPPADERAFDQACAELAASCVNTRPQFEKLVAGGTPPYGFANTVPNSGHLNARGHAALAEALAQELGHLALL
jgi:hypothetical protein